MAHMTAQLAVMDRQEVAGDGATVSAEVRPDLAKKLAIVVINYRTPELVISCLQSLNNQTNPVEHTIIVVDNNSSDGSVATLEKWIAANDDQGIVRLIRSHDNLGFSGGNNLGIASCEADFYLLLNSDTIVRPGAVATLLETAQRFPAAGIISPRLEWQDGVPQESCFRFPTPASELIAAAQTGPITALLNRFDVPLRVSDTFINPAWTSFACVLLRGSMIQQIGHMDEGFFLYFEDVEYCLRARRAGWDIVHNPQARVVHLRGGSSPVKQLAARRKALPRYYYESRARYFYVAHGRLGLTLANCLWWLGRGVSKGREVFGRRAPALPQRQWRDIWTNWRHPDLPCSRPNC